MKRGARLSVAAVLLLGSACQITVEGDGGNEQENAPAVADASAARQARARQPDASLALEHDRLQMRDLRLVVDKSDRELSVFQAGKLIREEPVAVGRPSIPTPVGSWKIHRVDVNPEWIPTDEPWARNRTRKAPGDPANPMGRARLVYRMSNTIHGTDETDSLGKAVSHGSIRVSNGVVLDLAEIVLRAGGSWEGPEWFRHMTEDRTTEYRIELNRPVPIEVRE